MKLTDRQRGYLSWKVKEYLYNDLAPYTALTRSGELFDAPLVGADKWIEENIDRSTASDIIKLFEEDHPEMALSQLVHLGLPMLKKE